LLYEHQISAGQLSADSTSTETLYCLTASSKSVKVGPQTEEMLRVREEETSFFLYKHRAYVAETVGKLFSLSHRGLLGRLSSVHDATTTTGFIMSLHGVD